MAAADVDNAEQPVREQLKKATLRNNPSAMTDETRTTRSLSKKRSHEDIDGEEATLSNAQHTRKRSRDSTAELEDEEGTARKRVSEDVDREEAAVEERTTTPEPQHKSAGLAAEDIASPKTKRSRLQETGAAPAASVTDTSSGFADKSVTSPFGSLAKTSGTPEAQPQTSDRAFAASGFSALSKSSSSGFGALGKDTSGFGGVTTFASTKSPDPIAEKNEHEPKSVFGGSLGAKSAFAAPAGHGTNGFGSSGFATSASLGSGFGSGSGFASLNKGGLSSFASGKLAPLGGGIKTVKPFGAPAEDDDAEEDGDAAEESGVKSPISVGTDEEKKDSRFYEQDLETGEEDEDVLFTGRAKLYTFATLDDGTSKAWKERGLGTVKLNCKRHAGADGKDSEAGASEASIARLVMRADGSQRVVLNSSITEKIDVANPGGGPPTHGILLFMGTTGGNKKLELLQLKLKNQLALDLYTKIQELQGKALSGDEI